MKSDKWLRSFIVLFVIDAAASLYFLADAIPSGNGLPSYSPPQTIAFGTPLITSLCAATLFVALALWRVWRTSEKTPIETLTGNKEQDVANGSPTKRAWWKHMT